MSSLANELRRLREDDADVALVLEVYEEIERVYRESLEAMGLVNRPMLEVANSADVTLSFRPTSSSAVI